MGANIPVFIDVVADTLCPWCYIGKRRLEKALARREGENIVVRWRPYLLNPDMPEAGMERNEYLNAKFAGAANAAAKYAPIAAAGKQEGLDFRFEAIERSPNTFNSHRLVLWAGQAGCQDAVIESLFRAYFIEGKDIGDMDVLAEIAANAGMNGEETRKRLDSDADRGTVQRAIDTARRIGVTGVPCFIFADRFAVSGAQSPDVLLRAIDQAVAAGGTDPQAQD